MSLFLFSKHNYHNIRNLYLFLLESYQILNFLVAEETIIDMIEWIRLKKHIFFLKS